MNMKRFDNLRVLVSSPLNDSSIMKQGKCI